MKRIIVTTILVHFLCQTKCIDVPSENDLRLSEEVSVSELLSFSFNKETYDDFKCNVSNYTLTHSCLYNPPFYESKSIRNSLSTLCLFFQYSEMKRNTRFKKNIENLFVMHSRMLHYMRDDLTEDVYDPQTFTDRLYKLDETIKNILEEQDPTKQIVRVQDQADRIVITQKLVSKNLHLKIVDDGEKVFSTEYLEDEALIAYYEVLTKMYEMYLEGLIGNNFKKETDLIAENFIKKQPTAKEECIYELFCKFNQILNSPDSKSKTFKCYPREYELSDEEKNSLKNQGRDLALRKLISGDVPEYFYELVFKVRSKIIWLISEGLTDDFDLYSGYDVKDVEIMLELVRMLKNYLQDSEKIFFYNDLSEESINNLVKICLELIL